MNRSPAQFRIALVLAAAGTVATVCLFPYLLALQPGAFALAPVSPAIVMAAQTAQSAVVVLLLGWAGLKLGAPIGLDAPWLAAWLYGRERPATSSWWTAALAGFVIGALIVICTTFFGGALGSGSIAAVPPAWKGVLAAPYGAIVEETICRAFLMGGIAWLLSRTTGGHVRRWQIAIAIVVAALLFGAGHLQLAGQLASLDAGVVTRVIGYNALAGCVFGALYWWRGLEHAMLAHFCADLILHGLAPVLTAA